jgi:hypothetical protein
MDGAISGSLMGFLFGAVARMGGAEGLSLALVGSYVVGGLVAGSFVGVALPLFRSRMLGGLIVGLGVALGAQVLAVLNGDGFDAAVAVSMTVAFGTIYGALLWDYKPDEPNE